MFKPSTISRYALGLLLALGSSLALANSPPAARGITDREIRIGMVNAQSGAAAALGIGMRVGAQAVFNEVNARGGVHGRRLMLRVADDAYEPEQTVEQTLRFVQNEGVLALFGFVGTPTVNAVIPLIADLHVPLIGVFSGAQSLRVPVVPEIFNVRASYDEETEALVGRLLDGGARKVAVVYQNDGFGVTVLSGTGKALAKRGLRVSASASFQRNTLAIRMALGEMVEAQPDAIVLAGPYEPVAAFVRQARALGLKSRFATVSFVGADSMLSRLAHEGDGMLISQVVPSPEDNSLPIVRECRHAIQRDSGEPLGFVNLEGCIAARVLVRALEQAGRDVTRTSLTEKLEEMRAEDIGGLIMKLSPESHQALSRVYMTQIVDRKLLALP